MPTQENDESKHYEVIYDNSTVKSDDQSITLRNEYLKELSSDHLYHLALSTDTHDLKSMFGDVKFVCVGGTLKRMKTFATIIGKELGINTDNLEDITIKSNRFSMFKIGPVLSVTHGMGISSISILLHELFKLIYYAKCKDVVFLRLGTCGGIGLDAGTVVISDKAVDGLLRPYYELYILGKIVRRPALFDQDLVKELKLIADEQNLDYKVVCGTTMCALDFYESQGRRDGAFCDYTEKQKIDYIESLKSAGVANIEMEAITFASMCYYSGIKGAIICVTLVDRFTEDQIVYNKEFQELIQSRPQILASKFIKKRLAQLEFDHNQNYKQFCEI